MGDLVDQACSICPEEQDVHQACGFAGRPNICTDSSACAEADLHKYMTQCKKDPSHAHFIPIVNFTDQDLPEQYREDIFMEFIRTVADLTIKIEVKMTSNERPEVFPDTDIPYSGYLYRGRTTARLGTGMVLYVENYNSEEKHSKFITCPCKKYLASDTQSEEWGLLTVLTAKHVVFDKVEAEHTTLRFFYDRDDSPLITVDTVHFQGGKTVYDYCCLDCYTCDQDLLPKLTKLTKQYWNLRDSVDGKYNSYDTLTFITSHPHGCPKQITLGNWLEKSQTDDTHTLYKYTASTCQGSSGAPVLFLGCKMPSLFPHVHSCFKTLNISGHGLENSEYEEQKNHFYHLNFSLRKMEALYGFSPSVRLNALEWSERLRVTMGLKRENFIQQLNLAENTFGPQQAAYDETMRILDMTDRIKKGKLLEPSKSLADKNKQF